MNDKMVELLESVRRRPYHYIGQLEVERIEIFLWGFKMGCLASESDDRDLHHLFINARNEIVVEHGWELIALSPSKEMVERGMPVEQIIDELLVMEMESWKRLIRATRPEG